MDRKSVLLWNFIDSPGRAQTCELAEGKGFEPSIPVSQYNGLANRRLQPLGHPSFVIPCGEMARTVCVPAF